MLIAALACLRPDSSVPERNTREIEALLKAIYENNIFRV
jgi:hypothetical protein